MEKIKKTILRAMTTGTTVTGGTIIIPDLNAVYYLKFGLKQVGHDIGFFDVLEGEPQINTKVGIGDGAYIKKGFWRGKIDNTGGENIIGFYNIQEYGMEYRQLNGVSWFLRPVVPSSGPLSEDNWDISITNLEPATQYEYRAYMTIDGEKYYGEILVATTTSEPI